jgi:transposase-like protein
MEKQAGVSPPNGTPPDPEVLARPRRRTFDAKFKMRILDETDRATEDGAIGAILRREALYSSHLTQWRKERQGGTLAALSKKRGRKPTKNPLADEVERLRKELAGVKQQLAQAEIIIEVQKKVASLLGIPLKTPDDDESDS